MKFHPFFAVIFIVIGIVLHTSCRTKQDTAQQQTPADRANNKTPDAPVKDEIPQISEKWDKTNAKEYLTISKLKKKNPSGGIYETEGYVVASVSGCDCPPGYECNCPIPNITISEKDQVPRSQNSDEDELIISGSPDSFDRDKKYRFKIEIPSSIYLVEIGGAITLPTKYPNRIAMLPERKRPKNSNVQCLRFEKTSRRSNRWANL